MPFVDLAEEIVARSPHGIPGFETFLDYCHFNVRGHLLAAHLLAPAVARLAGIDGVHADPEAALADEAKRRGGRRTDLPELDGWAGVDYEVEYLVDEMAGMKEDMAFRTDLEKRMSEEGPSPLALTFLGNRIATSGGGNSEDVLERRAQSYYEKPSPSTTPSLPPNATSKSWTGGDDEFFTAEDAERAEGTWIGTGRITEPLTF
ncbi:MAG: hypothetical protein M5R36_15560 [Deltaproteobacteria bacterium]|nr:hypothetical protein [Deltaproteobacteria bacterium]